MEALVPYLFLSESALGPVQVQVAVALPDGYRLGPPSGPNQNGVINAAEKLRHIDLPLIEDPQARHSYPCFALISISQAELDPGKEEGVSVAVLAEGKDPKQKPPRGTVRYSKIWKPLSQPRSPEAKNPGP
jgi:hypothetical protein